MNTRNLRFRSNRIADITALFHTELDPLYGSLEVRTFIEMLFEGLLGWDSVRLMTGRQQTIDQSDLLRFHWALEDLKKYRPIQHIIGQTVFCGCTIDVDPTVLIPRPETEEMVQAIIEETKSREGSPSSIIDLCTGSGCIAIALKKAFPTAEVSAVDLSEDALRKAQENAEKNGAEVSFRMADVLNMTEQEAEEGENEYDIIISNPPYVRTSEKEKMMQNVLLYEPPEALFVIDEDPLIFYSAIVGFARQHLAPQGVLAMEINEGLSKETLALLPEETFDADLMYDFFEKPRWIKAKKKT